MDLDLDLLFIRESTAQIVDKITIDMNEIPNAMFVDILEIISDEHPELYHKCNYNLFWRYSEEEFIEISSYFSYTMAITYGAERRFYVLLRDIPRISSEDEEIHLRPDSEILREACQGLEKRFYTIDMECEHNLVADFLTGKIEESPSDEEDYEQVCQTYLTLLEKELALVTKELSMKSHSIKSKKSDTTTKSFKTDPSSSSEKKGKDTGKKNKK